MGIPTQTQQAQTAPTPVQAESLWPSETRQRAALPSMTWEQKAGSRAAFRAMKKQLARQFERYGTFRTLPPQGFIPPSPEEIEQMAARFDLKAVSEPLVRDLANIAAGGQVCGRFMWEEILEKQAKGAAAAFEKQAQMHESVIRFLKRWDPSATPGITPLEKAICLLKALRFAGIASKEPACSSDGEKMEKALKTVEEKCRDVDSLSPDELDLMVSHLCAGAAGKNGHDGVNHKMEVLEEVFNSVQTAEMLRIARTLNEYSEMAVTSEFKSMKDNHGDDTRRRLMQSIDELPRIARQEWGTYLAAPALFMQRADSRAMSVKERVRRHGKKQLLYMLIDCSGSMSCDDGKPIGIACGVLMNRLRAVISGDAVVYYRFFDTIPYEPHSAQTRDEALKAMKSVAGKNYSGGGTSIDVAIKGACGHIQELMKDGKLVRPHIVVVTDGADSISVTRPDLGPNTLHAFLCSTDNSDLRSLAKKSGGIGVVIR